MLKEKNYFGISGVQLVAILLVAAAVIVSGLTSGCSALAQKANDRDYGMMIVTQFATLKYVEGEDNRIDPDKALAVHGQAVKIGQYVNNAVIVSVADLERYVLAKVEWSDLSPGDALATRAFITFLADELEAKVTKYNDDGQVIQSAEDVRVVAAFIVDTVTSTLEPYL